MFKNAYQSGLLSIFYSCGSQPLALWEMEVNNGHIKRVTDNEVNSVVLEIMSTNVAITYITCPPNNKSLGIKMPFLVMIVKNMKKYFSFEITVLDDKNMRRRFRISNFQSTTKIKPFCTTMPIGLSGGWNQIQFNLADFTRRAYGSQYLETVRVQVHANVRLRRIYFAERLYTEEELPQDYKLYLPLEKKGKKAKEKKEPEVALAPAPSPGGEKAPEVEAPPGEKPAGSGAKRKSLGDTRKSATKLEAKGSGVLADKTSSTHMVPPSEQGEEPPKKALEATEAKPEEWAETVEVPSEVETPAGEPAEATAEPTAEEAIEVTVEEAVEAVDATAEEITEAPLEEPPAAPSEEPPEAEPPTEVLTEPAEPGAEAADEG